MAKELVDYAIGHFRDSVSGLFYFTSDLDAPLVARKMEIQDNVTPASNSSMAKALFALGSFYGDTAYTNMAVEMLSQVREDMPGYGSGYSNWAMLALHLAVPFHEVVIAGPDADTARREISKHYLPNKLLAGSVSLSELPILKNRYRPESTTFYVCHNHVCDLPVETLADALKQIKVKQHS
jgi:uncharacterized protein YyaL (SSP411 family)